MQSPVQRQREMLGHACQGRYSQEEEMAVFMIGCPWTLHNDTITPTPQLTSSPLSRAPETPYHKITPLCLETEHTKHALHQIRTALPGHTQ